MPVTKEAGVSYRVLKRGADQIFTGEHHKDDDGKTVFTTHAFGAVVEGVEPKIAAALEARDMVEIIG